MKSTPSGHRRRQFLFGASAASVAAVATLVVATPPTSTRVSAGKTKAETGGGYQLSEHVRNYYRTTAV